MTIEDKLKELILSQYKSIRQFSIAVGIPYGTVVSILKRGIVNASIGNIITICKHFGISVDGLANGKIISADHLANNNDAITEKEFSLIKKYRLISPEGKETVDTILDIQYKAAQPKLKENEAI